MTKTESGALKGIGILMLLFHHLFLEGRTAGYQISFLPITIEQATHLASFCKICVSIFAFVSGYGLILSYQGERKNTITWLRNRYVRTFRNYWYVLILAWIVFMIINQAPIRVYEFHESIFLGFWNAMMEFLGLTHIIQPLSSQSILGTWWYMGATLAFLLLLPVVDFLLARVGPIGTIAFFVLLPKGLKAYPGGCSFYSFFPIFCVGAVFAKHEVFSRIDNLFAFKNRRIGELLRLFLFLCLTVLAYKIYYYLPDMLWWDFKFCFLPIPLILFVVYLCRWLTPLQTLLGYLGKHSANIYLTHNFIRMYAAQLVYGRKHFALVYAVLLLASIILSIVIELMKKATRYELLINKLYAKNNQKN